MQPIPTLTIPLMKAPCVFYRREVLGEFLGLLRILMSHGQSRPDKAEIPWLASSGSLPGVEEVSENGVERGLNN